MNLILGLVWGLIRIRLTVAQKDQHMPKNNACSYSISLSVFPYLEFFFQKALLLEISPTQNGPKLDQDGI